MRLRKVNSVKNGVSRNSDTRPDACQYFTGYVTIQRVAQTYHPPTREDRSVEEIITHLRENAQAYIVLTVCILPLIFVTRKYSVPLILYVVEYCLYLLVVHTIIFVILTAARWFKENSSMKALRADGVPADAPTWKMPYFDFWNTAVYDPQWIWKAEIVVAIIVLIAMWRLRPMKVQSKRVRRFQDSGKKRVDFSKYNPRNKRKAS